MHYILTVRLVLHGSWFTLFWSRSRDKLRFFFENNMRSSPSSVTGNRYVERSDNGRKKMEY